MRIINKKKRYSKPHSTWFLLNFSIHLASLWSGVSTTVLEVQCKDSISSEEAQGMIMCTLEVIIGKVCKQTGRTLCKHSTAYQLS